MPDELTARLRELAASARARPEVMGPVLLRVITDLFVLHPRHGAQDIQLFAELAGSLVADADEASLTAVARKLAEAPDAPESLLALIRARGGAAEQEILRADKRIAGLEARRIAAAGPCDQAAAIAARGDLDRDLTTLLCRRPERDIALALAANIAAPLATDDLGLLVARGRNDPALARTLLARGDLTIDHLPLYLDAGPAERAQLIRATRAESLAQTERADAAPMAPDVCLRLETAALRLKRAAFAWTLAGVLGCDARIGQKIVEDESGDALSLAFIALGAPREICARIFLVAFPRVALSREIFERNLALIDSLPRRDAARVIAAVTGPGSKQVSADGLGPPPHGRATETPAERDDRLIGSCDDLAY
jgi:hypothetical protein